MVNNINNITNSSHENTPLQNITVEAIEWGHHTEKDLRQILDSTYDEVVFWKKNFFLLPSGSAGKKFIREMTRLINAWNNNTALKNIALKAVMIMPSLLLQKPSFKSKSKQRSECLAIRIELWVNGDFNRLLIESRTIQSTLLASKKFRTPEQTAKSFAKLMMEGKVNVALRVLDEEQSGGFHYQKQY